MPSGCTIAEAIVLSRRKAPSSIGWGQPRSRRFSPNGRYVHYLRESTGSVRELWRADIESGRNEPVLPGIAMVGYDISPDGRDVVFATQPGRTTITGLARAPGPKRTAVSDRLRR